MAWHFKDGSIRTKPYEFDIDKKGIDYTNAGLLIGYQNEEGRISEHSQKVITAKNVKEMLDSLQKERGIEKTLKRQLNDDATVKETIETIEANKTKKQKEKIKRAEDK